MKKLHKVLDIIFIVSMIGSMVAFGIATIIFEPGKLLGDLFCLLVLILTFSGLGLVLSIEYDNTKQPEQSEEPSEYDYWDGDESDKISY